MTVVTSSQIEKELQKIHDLNKIAARGSLFNLVVWAPSKERATYLSNLIDRIREKFPCRMIFITHTDEESKDVEIKVSVKVEPSVTCDLIEIKAPSSQLNKLSFLILPHLLPDLPLYILWGQDPSHKNSLFDTLYPYASRVIFDSVCAKDLPLFAEAMISKPIKNFRDVNWSLLTSWRQLVARVIDTPEKIESAKKATSIKIGHTGDVSVQAQFIKAWLKEKLEVQESIFNLVKEDKEALSGDLTSIYIQTSDDNLFSFERKQDKATVHLCNESTCELPQTLPLNSPKRGFSFWRELLFEPNSPDYILMLKEVLHDKTKK